MRKLIFCLLLILLGTSSALATDVNFDYYVSPTDNDYVNNFNKNGNPNYFVQQTTGGITGGTLVPSNSGSYGNDLAVLKTPLANSPGVTHNISMAFFYDSSLTNPNRYNTSLQFFVSPFTDGNHYILGGVRGTGTNLELRLTGYYRDSRNWPWDIEPQQLSLVNNHWYQYELEIQNIGGSFGQLYVQGELFDWGESGVSSPLFVQKTFMTTYDEVFSPESGLQLGIYSEKWGGAAALDNFFVNSAVVPEPVSFFLYGIGGLTLGIARKFRKRVKK